MTYTEHLLLLGVVMVASWSLVTYFWPRMLLSVFKRGLLVKGFGDGPIPINTLYTEPQKLFAEPLHCANRLELEFDDRWREPRHACYSRLVGPQ